MSKLSKFKKAKIQVAKTTPVSAKRPLQKGYSINYKNTLIQVKTSLKENTPFEGVEPFGSGVALTLSLAPFGRNHYNSKLLNYSHKMSRNMTKAECNIWFNLLANRQLLNYKFLKQRVLHNYILDFYCSELLLCIEVDGEMHNLEYDLTRDAYLSCLGIKTLRFTNEEVLNNLDIVRQKIVSVIN